MLVKSIQILQILNLFFVSLIYKFYMSCKIEFKCSEVLIAYLDFMVCT